MPRSRAPSPKTRRPAPRRSRPSVTPEPSAPIALAEPEITLTPVPVVPAPNGNGHQTARPTRRPGVNVNANGGVTFVPPSEHALANFARGKKNGLDTAQGTSGLSVFSGLITEAYTPELRWPQVYLVYNDMRRRVPTIRSLLNAVGMLVPQATLSFEPASDDPADLRAAAFGNSVLDDMGSAMGQFVGDAMSALAFGWSLHEILWGRREQGWRSPDEDGWESKYDDGLITWRGFSYRRQSSFLRWEMDSYTKKLRGMWQLDVPNPARLLDIGRCVHFIPFRDGDNPEGFCLLESSYESYYYLKNYSTILGVGMERSLVGWPTFSFAERPSDTDLRKVKEAAATLLAGSELSYLTLPPGVSMRFETVANPNAATLLEIMRYYNQLILQTIMADFIWLGSGSTGSWALGADKSMLFLMALNSVMDTLVDTLNATAVKQLFRYNSAEFPGMTDIPKLIHAPIRKPIDLASLGGFVTSINSVFKISEEDQVRIRQATDGLLTENPTEAVDLSGGMGGEAPPDEGQTEEEAMPAEDGLEPDVSGMPLERDSLSDEKWDTAGMPTNPREGKGTHVTEGPPPRSAPNDPRPQPNIPSGKSGVAGYMSDEVDAWLADFAKLSPAEQKRVATGLGANDQNRQSRTRKRRHQPQGKGKR